jgi:AcrR family transcriptional regulator
VQPGTTKRHAELLDGLVELFLENGFRRFTLADLAEAMHCSKSTLYALGHSKEAVVRNVLVYFFGGAAEAIEARIAAETDPAARIVGYLHGVADELRPASPEFFDDVASHPDARAIYEQNTRIAAKRVAELIAAGVDSGGFRAVHPAFVADLVASEMSRIQTGDVLEHSGLGDAQAYDSLAELVLNGISAPGPPPRST